MWAGAGAPGDLGLRDRLKDRLSFSFHLTVAPVAGLSLALDGIPGTSEDGPSKVKGP